MRLRLRLLLVILAGLLGRRRRRLALLGESVLRLCVLPTDVDLVSMTNDRYHAMLDLARVDIGVRTGLADVVARNAWRPYVRFVSLRYRYPLRMLQGYRLRSRIAGWDDESFWVRHEFERRGRTTAIAIGRLSFHRASGLVPTRELLAAAGYHRASPPMPPLMAAGIDGDARLRAAQTDRSPAARAEQPVPAIAPAAVADRTPPPVRQRLG